MTCHLPFVNRPVAAGFFAALALVAGNAETAFAAVDNYMLRCPHPADSLMAGDLPAVGSLIVRQFLGYALTDQTPDHSSLSVFRQRLPEEVFAKAHEVVLEGLRTHGLLKGRHPGIDSSVMEAHASLSGLARRNVHPALLAIERPVTAAKAFFYFDGGSLGVRGVDAHGKAFAFSLPVEAKGKMAFYPDLVVGVSHCRSSGGVKYPCSDDSRKFIATLINKYADWGIDRYFCLQQLRDAPLDDLGWW